MYAHLRAKAFSAAAAGPYTGRPHISQYKTDISQYKTDISQYKTDISQYKTEISQFFEASQGGPRARACVCVCVCVCVRADRVPPATEGR
jgi:hypothetical protein